MRARQTAGQRQEPKQPAKQTTTTLRRVLRAAATAIIMAVCKEIQEVLGPLPHSCHMSFMYLKGYEHVMRSTLLLVYPMLPFLSVLPSFCFPQFPVRIISPSSASLRFANAECPDTQPPRLVHVRLAGRPQHRQSTLSNVVTSRPRSRLASQGSLAGAANTAPSGPVLLSTARERRLFVRGLPRPRLNCFFIYLFIIKYFYLYAI